MIMLIHRICIALSGVGSPNAVAILAMVNAAKEVLNWNARKQRMLKNIPLPSAMAIVIVRKSSSARITSAASFATSVPFRPIAMPISEPFSAVASFTPEKCVSEQLHRCGV